MVGDDVEAIGSVVQVSGAVVDVLLAPGNVAKTHEALEVRSCWGWG